MSWMAAPHNRSLGRNYSCHHRVSGPSQHALLECSEDDGRRRRPMGYVPDCRHRIDACCGRPDGVEQRSAGTAPLAIDVGLRAARSDEGCLRQLVDGTSRMPTAGCCEEDNDQPGGGDGQAGSYGPGGGLPGLMVRYPYCPPWRMSLSWPATVEVTLEQPIEPTSPGCPHVADNP